jgi:hypothetical protein
MTMADSIRKTINPTGDLKIVRKSHLGTNLTVTLIPVAPAPRQEYDLTPAE